MKKCLILLLMLLMCLSGCGTLSQSDEISIVLLHGWGTMEEDNQAMREIYSEFEKDNPDISLKMISMPSPENVTSKVKEMISVGKLPNLIYIGETGIDTLYSFMVTQGYVIDIMPYIEKDKEFQSMIAPETLMKWKTADGKLYTVTDVLNTGGYWYNKQIFENAKIQKTPENWKEFLECCKKIKQWAEQEKLDTVSMHLDYNTIECMMQSYIGDTDSDEKSISEALKLLNEIKDYADVEKNYTYRDRLRSFNVGHSAIYAGGIDSEQKINPKLIICASWDMHVEMCIEAMKAGKYVGCEVGGAYSLRECWKLIETYEETKVPVMFLENCLYGRDEMMVLNMAEQGVLGEIVHCEGGYRHDLREEVAFGKENRHYRLSNYIHRNTENYPTHELGPIAKILHINRGNRLLSLTSVSSKAAGLKEYIKEKKADDEVLSNTTFNQGDIVNTIIKCSNGETILLTLDTTLPRYYSRGFTVQGTKGMYTEDNRSIFLDGEKSAEDHFEWKKHWGNVEEYRDKYEHPVWKKYLDAGVKKGHDGMDFLVFSDFIKCVQENSEAVIDVYDMATWMSISVLAEESISMGGQPIAIPDFTSGKWMNRK